AREEPRDHADRGVDRRRRVHGHPGAPDDARHEGTRDPDELAVGQLDGATRRAEAQRDLVGGFEGQQTAHPITLPGLRIPRGSKASLIARCIASPTGPTSRCMPARLSSPTPCSPVTVPPMSIAASMIAWKAA